MSVAWAAAYTWRDRKSEWGQLLFAARGMLTVHTDAGLWVVPAHQAVWVPAGVRHGVEVAGGVAMRALYLSGALGDALHARLPGAAALSRGHCRRAVEIAPSPRLIQFDAQHVARKGCPCRTDRRSAISATSAHSHGVGLAVNCRRVRSKYGETVIAARALVLHLAEYKRSVGAAKSEGVRQRNIDGAFARFVGHEIDGSIDIVALQAQHESAQMLYGAITVNKQNAGFDSGGSHKEHLVAIWAVLKSTPAQAPAYGPIIVVPRLYFRVAESRHSVFR